MTVHRYQHSDCCRGRFEERKGGREREGEKGRERKSESRREWSRARKKGRGREGVRGEREEEGRWEGECANSVVTHLYYYMHSCEKIVSCSV